MESEKPAPQPLSGQEVQDAILFKVRESLSRTCHLKFDNAYTAFTADITIKLTLNDYGRDVQDNHIVHAEGVAEGIPLGEPETSEAQVTIQPAPPNQVRQETHQDIPVTTVENGKRVEKRVKYQPRKAK